MKVDFSDKEEEEFSVGRHGDRWIIDDGDRGMGRWGYSGCLFLIEVVAKCRDKYHE